MKRRLVRFFLLTTLVSVSLASTGCGSSGGFDPKALEAGWVLESFGGASNLVPTDPAITTDITMAAGKTNGSGGVNSFSGTYEASGDSSISFGPLASTRMAGPPEAMAQEAKFFAALEVAKHFEISKGKLVLSDSGNNTLMVLAPK